MAFTQKTINAFEMTQRMAAAEIKAVRPGYRAFVGVYPPLSSNGIPHWRIKKFEIPETLVHESVYDGDLSDHQMVRVDTLEEVEQVLATWNVDTSAFDAAWKSDYPL